MHLKQPLMDRTRSKTFPVCSALKYEFSFHKALKIHPSNMGNGLRGNALMARHPICTSTQLLTLC